MRKDFFFLPTALVAALALTGCQNDEPGPNPNGGTGDKCGYVAVNIVQPRSINPIPGSKADASEGFEYGTDAENYAAKGTFFILNESNQLIQDAQTLDLNGSGEGNHPEVERIYSAVLVIDGVTEKPSDAKKIVCVLNAPDAIKNIKKPETGSITLDDLASYINDYRGKSEGYIMSNSVYMDGTPSAKVLATDITKIAGSAAEALVNPVEIYVERTVAKVVATSDATNGITDGKAKPAIDGVETTLDINITGIEVANIASRSYLFKNIGTGYSDFTWSWNDATNKRSYWETVPEIGTGDNKLTFENKSYNEITDNTEGHPITDTKNISFTEYIQPNTSDTKTAILVTAQLMKDNAAFKTLAYIRGGYTSIDNAKKVVATYLATQGYYKKDPANENRLVQLDENDLEWKNNFDFKEASQEEVVGLKDYEVVAQLLSTVTTIYNHAGEEIADGVNAINSLLKSNETVPASYRARVYTDGKCYYYVAIDHADVAGLTAGTLPGVVRNHIYKLNLESVTGIGTPVFDPKDKIIPDKPSDEESFYLAARVNVLAWKLATQTVKFEGN